jgi:hypothetical protein
MVYYLPSDQRASCSVPKEQGPDWLQINNDQDLSLSAAQLPESIVNLKGTGLNMAEMGPLKVHTKTGSVM